LTGGHGQLEVIEEIIAGATAQKTGEPGQCWRIMTGAPIPAGADAVVMHERTTFIESDVASGRHADAGAGFGRLGRVQIAEHKFRVGQNIMRRGAAMRRGDALLSPGHTMRPIEIGLLAEVGRTEITVIDRPSAAILSTGNELVPPDRLPAAGQIRNSNGPMLAAAIRAAGATPVELGISRDEPAALRNALGEGLRSDVLIISGGVSAGALDLVPGLLQELGVVEVFHKINLRPGKPLWFGSHARPTSSASSLGPRPSPLAPSLVFGLPGNPVSSLVCFELFVRAALAQLAGRTVSEALATTRARLSTGFVQHGDRPTFHPAVVSSQRAALTSDPTIVPLRWSGSADLRALASANALAIFPPGDREFTAGEEVEILPLFP
jgi:molybdopterin molybdotransferase